MRTDTRTSVQARDGMQSGARLQAEPQLAWQQLQSHPPELCMLSTAAAASCGVPQASCTLRASSLATHPSCAYCRWPRPRPRAPQTPQSQSRGAAPWHGPAAVTPAGMWVRGRVLFHAAGGRAARSQAGVWQQRTAVHALVGASRERPSAAAVVAAVLPNCPAAPCVCTWARDG